MRRRKIKELRIKKASKALGHVAETNQKVGDFPCGHQVIILRTLDNSSDPLLLVEQRGRTGSVHLSEIKIFEPKFEI